MPVRNEAHDIGTDMLVAAVDDRLFQRGLVGVQAKAGASWFRRPVRSAGGDLLGWWFYEDSAEHFDDWVKHALPHLLVLHDIEADISYWVHVTAESVERVGQGCRVLVPVDQTIDDDHAQQLLEVVTAGRPPLALEGTSFDASAAAVAPGERLRYALLAPRLVAPHRNRGHRKAPLPEEAAALVALGRLGDLRTFAEEHSEVPDPESEERHKDWRWRFVNAFRKWVAEDELAALREAFAEAPDPASKAAAGVALIVALRQSEQHADSMAQAESLIRDDDLPPVDHAWILTHRARMKMEMGDTVGAVDDAATALRALGPSRDDPTASAIGASAAWALFRAEFAGARLGSTLTAADTAVTWWRNQLVAEALGQTTLRTFRMWAEDTSHRVVMEDVEQINLFASETSADLAADHGAWCGHCSLRCRIWATDADDEEHLEEALDGLRRAGDTASLKLAAAHVRRSGPVLVLARAVARIQEESWTSTTFQTNLVMLQLGGDLLPERRATDLALHCARWVQEPESPLVARLRPTFHAPVAALEALIGLLPAAGPEAHAALADLILTEPVRTEPILERALIAGARAMNRSLVDDVRIAQLRALAEDDTSPIGAELLGLFSSFGDDAAGAELRTRAFGGDRHALGAHVDVTLLTDEEAHTQIQISAGRVRELIANAAGGTMRIDGWDPVRDLTLFNLWFPDLAEWDPVLSALSDDRLGIRQKRGAGDLLVALAHKIPQEVRSRLSGMGPALQNHRDFGFGGPSTLGGLPVTLPAVAADLTEQEMVLRLAPLALGSDLERRDLATFLGVHDVAPMRATLAGLLRDGRATVRAAAAHAIGRLVARRPADPLLDVLARAAAEDSGTLIPLALLTGLRHEGPRDAPFEHVFQALATHPACEVARAASIEA